MVQTQNSAARSNQAGPLAPAMLLGAGFALIIISFFVFGVDSPRPEWGEFWMIRPLIVTPLAGATGGAFYYFLDRMRAKGQLGGAVAIILSLVVYIIGLWLGIVLGLDGTMWN